MYLGVYLIQFHNLDFLFNVGDSSNACIVAYKTIKVGSN
jgi:hypothetical protein